MINYFFEEIEDIEFEPRTSLWLNEMISLEGKKTGKINYIFCSDDGLLKVNQEYLQHDYYTDIITFDYVKGKNISADIFVSLPRIFDNAEKLAKNFNQEFHRVLAHGILHLCGYKDKSEEEIKIMRQKEDFYLDLL